MDISRLDPTARRSIRRLLDDPTFEMIPLSNATEQASYLPEGARISVTASPNKTLDDSLDLAAELCQAGYRVTPHLSARMSRDMAHVEHLVHRMQELGLTTAFVVGGDPDPVGEFHDGVSLLEAMDRVGHSLAIGVPCYPEGHPDIPEDDLWRALEAKQRYAAWMTSQMCFDGDALRKWGINARQRGVELPLVLGLPGAADRMKLLRISTRIGVGRSLSFLRKNTGLVSAFVKPGGYDPAELLIDIGDDLADPTLDIVGCHIYTFNQCDTTEEWRQRVLQALV
jgi:methylenetetrahydrofolate reductase (NADPH)